jgi:hypothetical protein
MVGAVSSALDLDLGPETARQLTLRRRPRLQASFGWRLQGAAWEAEHARIELLDASATIDIQTGDPDWDAALAFSQRAAFGLFFRENQNLPHPSFVTVRQPDHGFSNKGDGTDYAPAWSGQSVMDAYTLSGLLPRSPQLVRGLLLNFLIGQDESGETDGRPGLGGQRSKLLAAPMLAALAWRIHHLPLMQLSGRGVKAA